MDFIAKWGGQPCPRCKSLVRAGQRVMYRYGTKQIQHVVCPTAEQIEASTSEQRVFFRYNDCGCRAGHCVHEPLERGAAEQ